MNRIILFRGKRIDDGTWMVGYLWNGDNHSYIIPYNTGVDYTKNRLTACAYEVDKETIGQFTGLVDKNGVKIFEGDIVVYDNTPYNAYAEKQTGEIVWRYGSLCFKYSIYDSVHYRAMCTEDFFAEKSEVVGNVYEQEKSNTNKETYIIQKTEWDGEPVTICEATSMEQAKEMLYKNMMRFINDFGSIKKLEGDMSLEKIAQDFPYEFTMKKDGTRMYTVLSGIETEMKIVKKDM